MSKNKTTLVAVSRAKAGKGAARAVRRTGSIPGVIYGDNKEPVLVSLPAKELGLALAKKGFFTRLCDLSVDGGSHLVLPRDVQLDAVTDRPLHADFLRVTDKTLIRVEVPVTVINHKDCPGLAKGGVLNIVRHEVEVYCPATSIPDEFIVNLAGIEVGHSVHVEDLEMPKGVEAAGSGDFTVVTIVAPSAMKSDADATAATTDAAAPAAAAAAPAKGAPAAAAAKAPAAGAKGAPAAPAAKKK
jgi:large subunit ribosomal protein L25